MHSSTDIKLTRVLLVSVVVIYLMACYLAYTRGLTSTLEGESGITAREFLRSGDWSVNHMNGLPDYDKPSFFYWLIALASLFTGGVSELAVRIPSLVSSLAVMFMFRAYRPDSDRTDAADLPVLAAFIFISCPKVFWMTQMGRMDMTLNLFCFSTLTAFILYMREKVPSRKKAVCYWLFFAASGLAVLTKGPVGVLITWPPVFLFLMFNRQWRDIRRFFLGWGMLLFMAIALPWYLNACISTDWEFFRHFFLEESVSRFGNIWSGIEFKQFNRSSPGIYLVYFFTGFFPWSVLFPVAVFLFLRKKGRHEYMKWFKITETHRILIYYIAWIFLFFSVCGVKRSDYILPLYPAAALLTADFTVRLHAAEENPYGRFFAKFAQALSCLLAAIIAIILAAVLILTITPIRNLAASLVPERIGVHMNWFSDNFMATVLPAIISSAVVVYCLYYFRKSGTWSKHLTLLAGVVSAAWIVSASTVLEFIDHCKDMQPWCSRIEQAIDGHPLYSYHFFDEECAFYLGRPTIVSINRIRLEKLLRQKDEKIFVLLREKDMKKLEKTGISIPWVLVPEDYCWRPLYLLSNVASGTDLKNQAEPGRNNSR